jgi:hypothetical protein
VEETAAEAAAPSPGAVQADGVEAAGADTTVLGATAAASGDALPSAGKEAPLAAAAGWLLAGSLFLAGLPFTSFNVPAKSDVPSAFLVESADWALACEAASLGAGALATETTGALKAMVTEFMPVLSK